MAFRFPDDSQRICIIGATGSGKTFAAAHQLSERSYDVMPWIIFDFKTDKLLNRIKFAKHILVTDAIPDKPGIYIVHPHPDQIDDVADMMRRIWERGNVGIYIDEGYMVCGPGRPNPWFRTILTQGRSLHIPVILVSQRPVFLDVFAFTEADFYQVFRLNYARDIKRMEEYVPADLETRLPEYWSYYYDVGQNKIFQLKPVPDEREILATFEERLKVEVEEIPRLRFV